jgi:hypothetical protein
MKSADREGHSQTMRVLARQRLRENQGNLLLAAGLVFVYLTGPTNLVQKACLVGVGLWAAVYIGVPLLRAAGERLRQRR